jgi:hypothetical protein
MSYVLCPMSYVLCLCLMSYVLCPMSYVLCPMPYALRPAPCALRHQIQFFLKNHAKTYADPKIAAIVTNPATDKTAIPDRAAPLVHPLASCAPYTKNRPPANAKISLLPFEILGDFSILNLSLFDKAPEINPPASTPSISRVSQFCRGFLPSSKYLL